MSFLDIRFPTGISYGTVGGPGYSTSVASNIGGTEARNQNLTNSRCVFDVAKACKTDALRTALLAFFRVAKGKKHSFRFRDPSDYEVSATEGVLTTIGAGSTWQLAKRYTNSAGTEDRPITLPVNAVVKQGATTLTLGVDYSLSLTTGILTVLGSPQAVPDSWSGEFDVPCRFDTDVLRLVAEDIDLFRSQSIPVIEDRV